MSGAAISVAPPEFGPAEFQEATGADEAAMARLVAYADLLGETNAHTNLVSAASLADLWRRHMFDSAQLMPLIPANTRTHVDFGSGAGFPGLVIAALMPAGVGLETTLIESIEKKCAFLRRAAEVMGLAGRVRVLRGRAEEVPAFRADLITARAVAALPVLLSYARRFSSNRTLCLFPKGRTAADELTAARRSWKLAADMIESRSDPDASILAIRSFAPKGRS
jgi:16S rRNA (guanine527-N7)-methyltransferase